MAGRPFPLVDFLSRVGGSLSPASLRKHVSGEALNTSPSSTFLLNRVSQSLSLHSDFKPENVEYDVILHSNLEPSWNPQQTLDEQETEKGDDVKRKNRQGMKTARVSFPMMEQRLITSIVQAFGADT
eukprot:TRINITY_DN13580_c0_g1_i1.p1 TRINITY_DN13580_c0_g1~~TRINITY_DN13580_c0_g1_i1.p1  ORF type:complete len:127 (-),score=18.28 TRINITY_DN13580_c0_g1_i1:16-396(-)